MKSDRCDPKNFIGTTADAVNKFFKIQKGVVLINYTFFIILKKSPNYLLFFFLESSSSKHFGHPVREAERLLI